MKWRNNIVRAVCESDGEKGDNLRNLWVKVYKGDLKWGVRDERLIEKGWPSNAYLQNQDRNKWIASSLVV